jgi:lysozyme
VIRTINATGLVLVKQFEGCELVAYLCPANVWTIGFGSTGKHVKPGMRITEDEAEKLLRNDLARFEAGVADLCKVATDNQFSALVSFAFNVGLDALRTSTLRRLHNEGKYEEAAAQFARWNKGSGRVLPGLVKRRASEAQLYRSAA